MTTLLDAPCGDFNWMQKVNLDGIQYTGGDIVQTIIDQNNKKHKSDHHHFKQLDLMSDNLGDADLLFCRDCLVHLSFADMYKILENVVDSNIKYIMTTTFPEQLSNKDIVTGGWRPLNFNKPPFNFPQPIELLNEKCTEMDGAFKDKSMAVWEVNKLSNYILDREQ